MCIGDAAVSFFNLMLLMFGLSFCGLISPLIAESVVLIYLSTDSDCWFVVRVWINLVTQLQFELLEF